MDWVAEGVKALVAGMGTVFVVLILIALVISLFQHIGDGESKAVDEKKPDIVPVQNEPVVDESDDLELVAVISAAIAASLNTTTDKLVVKSIRRTNKNSRWKLG